MNPTAFPEHNKVLTKPKGMTDEECASLEVFETEDGRIYSKWTLTDEELASIVEHRTVWLCVVARGSHPPVSLQAVETVFQRRTKDD